MNNHPLTRYAAYKPLQQLRTHLASSRILDLFAKDAKRAQHFQVDAAGLHLDYSKNLLTKEAMRELVSLANQANVCKQRDDMFAGEKINSTEQRAVLHTLLRTPKQANSTHPLHALVLNELNKMKALCTHFQSGDWRGYSGKRLRHVIVIGIGGSYLGPKLACEALSGFRQGATTVHFIANVDAHELTEVLNQTPAEEVLVIVISKSFTTQETSVNANTVVKWLVKNAKSSDVISQQLVAISSNTDAVNQFGIPDQHILTMWDWVGGRYSLWSAVGFPIALLIGFENFKKLLLGAYAMDRHFCDAALDQNLPVILALVGIWHSNFFNFPQYAVLPYDHRLRSLPGYLQQLDMESNGKSVTKSGESVSYDTGPVIFGEAGTNGQHAFYQLIHQGTHVIPCDFIGCQIPDHSHNQHHHILLANMVAQSQALMQGRSLSDTKALLAGKQLSVETIEQLAPHMTFEGNRPSNTILLSELNPESLGALLAAYEHKIFVQGAIWGINSFDQMGVELGKVLASNILPCFEQQQIPAEFDGSTKQLLSRLIGRR